MNNKFDSMAKGKAKSTMRGVVPKKFRRCRCAGYLVIVLTALGLLTSPAQSLQPEVLVSINNTNGSSPRAPLTIGDNGDFYGTTSGGGSSGYGTVFKLTTNGTLITPLPLFNNVNGINPNTALTLGNDGNFYGTSSAGGSSGAGIGVQGDHQRHADQARVVHRHQRSHSTGGTDIGK